MDKAKNRLISYKPIRSALHTQKIQKLDENSIKEILMDKTNNLESIGVNMKFERFKDHESIKF